MRPCQSSGASTSFDRPPNSRPNPSISSSESEQHEDQARHQVEDEGTERRRGSGAHAQTGRTHRGLRGQVFEAGSAFVDSRTGYVHISRNEGTKPVELSEEEGVNGDFGEESGESRRPLLCTQEGVADA